MAVGRLLDLFAHRFYMLFHFFFI